MKIIDMLSPDSLRVPLIASDKLDAIASLVELLADQGRLTDRKQVLQAVLDREKKGPTGMEFGLAVPHGRTSSCPAPVLAVGLADPGIDFQCRDGKLARVIVLLIGPAEQSGNHVQALARISRLMLNDRFRADILAAKSPLDAYNTFVKYENP